MRRQAVAVTDSKKATNTIIKTVTTTIKVTFNFEYTASTLDRHQTQKFSFQACHWRAMYF